MLTLARQGTQSPRLRFAPAMATALGARVSLRILNAPRTRKPLWFKAIKTTRAQTFKIRASGVGLDVLWGEQCVSVVDYLTLSVVSRVNSQKIDDLSVGYLDAPT